jgi:thiol-disulfide isomerase/thioredoxin
MRRRVLLGVAGGTVAMAGWPRKSAAQTPRPLAEALISEAVRDVPAFSFTDATGAPQTLAGSTGQPLVVNFWATWCMPCIAEMPDLDRLAAMLGTAARVLPLSSDREGAAAVEAWYKAHAITHLPVLLDPKGAASRAVGVRGIPTTLLIGADGREHGRAEGAVAWTAPESFGRVLKILG